MSAFTGYNSTFAQLFGRAPIPPALPPGHAKPAAPAGSAINHHDPRVATMYRRLARGRTNAPTPKAVQRPAVTSHRTPVAPQPARPAPSSTRRSADVSGAVAFGQLVQSFGQPDDDAPTRNGNATLARTKGAGCAL